MRGRTAGLAMTMSLLVAVTTPEVASARVAATNVRAGNPQANIVIGGLKLLLGRITSGRVFKNVGELETEVNTRYDAYLRTATQANDARSVQLLQQERTTLLDQLKTVRNNAYQQFRKPEAMQLFGIVANTGPASRLLNGASTDIGTLAGRVEAVRNTLSGGGPVNVAELTNIAGRIDRWNGMWSMIAGSSGRGLQAAAERVSASFRQFGSTTTTPNEPVDAALASVQSDLQLLSQALTSVQNVPRRPRGGGLFGFVANLFRVDRTLVDVFGEIFNPRLRNVPGRSKAELDRALRAAVIEMMRRRWSDCTKRTGFEIRNLADNPDAGLPFPGKLPLTLGPVDERLPLCQSPTTEQVVDEGDNAPTVVTPPDGGTADQLTGGGVYAVDQTSTMPGAVARMTSLSSADLSVRDVGTGRLISLSAEVVGTPDVQLVFDLADGTFSGSFDANFSCDGERCLGSVATGSARATFGPIPFDPPPVGPPDDYPFPEHHWNDPSPGVWYAGAAVPIEIALSGTDLSGAPADYSTTVTGWVSARLSPQGTVGEALPYGWRGNFSAVIDHPDTVNPQWSLGIFSDVDIWDGNVPRPSTGG